MKKVKNKQGKTSQKIKTKKQSAQVIKVKNAEGDADTKAQILVQNKINYTPKVSVIIPVYNMEAYLRQCLDSVIKQTLEEIEIICVNDGSTDNSLEILKEYAAKDKRITILKQKNLHAGVARNAGLAFKNGTDDCRQSPAMDIISELINKNIAITAYDPKAMDTAKALVGDKIHYAQDMYSAVKGADVLAILTEWPEFSAPDFSKLEKLMKRKVIFDLRNMLPSKEAAEWDFTCYSVERKRKR